MTNERETQAILIYAVIVLGGGFMLTSMNFLPWFAIGLPLVVAFAAGEYLHRTKAPTYSERQATRHAAAEAASH